MLTKEQIKKTIDALPEGFTLEDVIEELILIDKIEQGCKDIADGMVFSAEEAKSQLNFL